MTAEDFAAFYEAVHGYPPFPWQERLLEEVVTQGWRDVISLPTSSGKTSVIDIAVFHLALEAGKKALERQAALRIFFVIDRRVVVDEAAEHAAKIAKALIESKNDAVMQVAEALKRFEAEYPLDVAVLRGGMYRDNTWVDEPNQPLVCVSTVDQVGSRLLFRGYQVSDEAKPVHAGLVGNDSLILVDEAHLSTPFLDTISAVTSHSDGREEVARGIQLVKMSATIDDDAEPFGLDEKDYATAELNGRLAAAKPVELRTPAKNFEDEIVQAAKELSLLPDVSVIGVVVNTVAAARAVFEKLRSAKDAEAILLTGRNRPYEAQRLWEDYKGRIKAEKGRVSERRLFVVATQTVEVGANLDFEALVSESAPLDALRQRFGRLNRLGRPGEARAILVRRPKEDPVYGEATVKTWDLLLSLPALDFGVLALDAALQGVDTEGTIPLRECGPLVFPKYLEMWAQTNPRPDPDPDVAAFLHGKDALEDADIQVVWRADLGENWKSSVESAPPVSAEALALPIGTLKRWLRGETKMNVADVEGVGSDSDALKDGRAEAQQFLIWRGNDKSSETNDVRKIRPGDVVVLPNTYGGCDRFGWHPESGEAVEDIGDEANNQLAARGLRRPRVRLQIFAEKKLQGEDQQRFLTFCEVNEGETEEAIDDAKREIKKKLEGLFPGEPKLDLVAGTAVWRMIKSEAQEILPSLKPEDQDDDSAGQEEPITLKSHTDGVVEHARNYALRCGLDDRFIEDLALAAELHDLGKWDDRFQAWLRGSLRQPGKQSEPLAKGGAVTITARRRQKELAGYPDGARHESGSVLLSTASGELSRAHDPDLVLHLVGTHHGYGRPLLPFWKDDESETILAVFKGKSLETGTGRELAKVSSGWIDRFAQLNERYGYWGLAYLETVLRRADCMQSRKEQSS